MKPLLIESTDNCPKVVLNEESQIFLIEGESRPTNTFNFYQPIVKWLEGYGKLLFWQKEHFGKNRRMTFQFKLTYFHSTSAKFISDILHLLDQFYMDGYDVRVKWYYHKEDLEMKESGEEYMKMLVKLPIKMIAYEDPEVED